MQVKKAFQLGVALLLIIGLAQGCKAQTSAASQANNNSALQSLKSRLQDAGGNAQMGYTAVQVRYSNVAVSSCILTFTEHYVEEDEASVGGGRRLNISTYTVPLGKLASAEYQQHGWHGEADVVSLKSSSAIITHKWRFTKSSPNVAPSSEDGSESLKEYEVVAGDDSRQDLTDAFSSAVELCSGKKVAHTGSSSQPNSGPPLEETLQSITTGLQKAGISKPNPATYNQTFNYSEVAVNGCTLSFTATEAVWNGPSEKPTKTLYPKVPLGKMSSARVVAMQQEHSNWRMILLKSSDKVIAETWTDWMTWVWKDGKKTNQTGSDNFEAVKLYTDDSQLAQSLVDSLNHAIELCHGVSDKVASAIVIKPSPLANVTSSTPETAPAATPPASGLPAGIENVGVYYRDKSGAWIMLEPEIVNFKTGGALKTFTSQGIVKPDVNGHIPGAHAKQIVSFPVTLAVYVPAGVNISEYQLLRLRQNSNNREFRSVTGGVLHSSGGAQRDEVPYQSTKIAPRVYKIDLDQALGKGEYGLLPSGSHTSTGKIYTLSVSE